MLSVSPGTLAGALAKHEIAKISCIDHVPTVRDTSERVWCILSSPTNFSRFCRVHTQRHGNCQHRQQEHVSDVDPSHPRRRFDFKIRPAHLVVFAIDCVRWPAPSSTHKPRSVLVKISTVRWNKQARTICYRYGTAACACRRARFAHRTTKRI